MEFMTTRDLPAHPTIKQTANHLGVDARTVRRWISDGRLIA
jgi:predicted site-specific integrase-resolvase